MELYILDSSYNPTSAGVNRLLAFGLALQKKGVKVTYFYLFPYRNGEKCTRYLDKLKFVYLWENSPFKNKYLNTIRSMRKFYKLMKPEIPVYAYSLLNCIYFLRKFLNSPWHSNSPALVPKVFLYFSNYSWCSIA